MIDTRVLELSKLEVDLRDSDMKGFIRHKLNTGPHHVQVCDYLCVREEGGRGVSHLQTCASPCVIILLPTN